MGSKLLINYYYQQSTKVSKDEFKLFFPPFAIINFVVKDIIIAQVNRAFLKFSGL